MINSLNQLGEINGYYALNKTSLACDKSSQNTSQNDWCPQKKEIQNNEHKDKMNINQLRNTQYLENNPCNSSNFDQFSSIDKPH